LYGTPPGNIHVVPNGVEDAFLNTQPAQRGPWLVCTATITERKRVLELAEAAVRYEGPIQDREKLAQVYREARGFVLLSAMESLSLSALEAAACECPLLLSDLPWARSTFGGHASYCPVSSSTAETAAYLRQFYDAAPG